MPTGTQSGLAPSRHALENGAVIIAKEAHTIPAVTIHAAVKAGTVYDPPAHLGVAHFLSRVIDRGTPTRSADAIAEQLDSRGVFLSVAATRHLLTVSCNCLGEDFEPMLELIGDVLMRPTFPSEEIETRRGEMVTAIRQDQDNPAVRAVEELLELLYPGGHPYGRRPKGSIETVERLSREEILRFHRARFAPVNLDLIIVGAVEPRRAIGAAERVFGDWQGEAEHAVDLPPPARATRREQRIVRMMNKAQAEIAYGFASVARLDPAYHALLIVNNALGQYSLGGRLGDSIRERQGMAYHVFSSFEAGVIEGPLMVRAGVHPKNVERALASIDEEVIRMAADGLTPRELAESTQFLVGSLPRTFETNAAIATFLQTEEFFGLGLDYDVRLPGLLWSVTLDQAHEVAARVLVADRAAVIVAGPYDQKAPS